LPHRSPQQVVRILEKARSAVHEIAAFRSQERAARGSAEDGVSDLTLEIGNRFGDGGLRDAHRLRRSGERARPRNGNHVI
jgi:hypothetical protein